jgi:hypothetical protein
MVKYYEAVVAINCNPVYEHYYAHTCEWDKEVLNGFKQELNSGYQAYGNSDYGYGNSGYQAYGNSDYGYGNSGYQAYGNSDYGYGNSGYQAYGNSDYGYGNSGYGNSGYQGYANLDYDDAANKKLREANKN